MKKNVTLLFLLVSFNIYSQALEDLTAPSMPAANIIGTQINEINTPKTWKALEAALLNNFTNSENDILLPNNYAFEVNPFMLSKRPNFTYLEYLSDSIKHNVWRNLSFSFASTSDFALTDSTSGSALGFGGRTVILNGKVNQKLEQSYRAIVEKYNELKALEAQLRTMIGVYLLSDSLFSVDSLRVFILRQDPLSAEDAAEIINDIFDQLPADISKETVRNECTKLFKETRSSKALAEFRELLSKVQSERYGWRWEIDGAMAMAFPTNDFTYSFLPKYGIWSNLSFTPAKREKLPSGTTVETPSHFEFIGLVRWLKTSEDFVNKYNVADTMRFDAGGTLDLGLRTIYSINRFSAEFEFIYRLNRNKEFVTINGLEYSRNINSDSHKYVLNLNYNITDNIILSYSIGKNYDLPTSNVGNLISGFSLNFGFGGVDEEEVLDTALKQIE